jgi:hypothetical protein
MQLETSVIIPLFLAASLAVLPAAAAPQSLNNSNARQEKQEALSPAEACPGPFKTLAEKHLCLKLAEACPGPYKTTAEMYSCQSKLPQELFNETMRKNAEESVKHEEADKEKRYMMYLTSAGKACEDQHPNNITAIMECLQGRPVLSPFQEG